MQTVDELRLEQDLAYRFGYLTQFMGFTEQDIAAIHASASRLAPLVPTLVDAVYDQLFKFSATKRHFVPRQSGYEGATPTDVAALRPDHPMIEFRKQHLGNYLRALVTRPYDLSMVEYLDRVGKLHTPKLGSKELHIPLVQMNALMGFVADALIATILSWNLPSAEQSATVRAFNKLLWLQNDLITRHYAEATK